MAFCCGEDAMRNLLLANIAEVLAVARTMGGGSSWHSGVEDIQVRCLVVDCVGKVLESMHLDDANTRNGEKKTLPWLISERTRRLVVEVEQHLYLTAHSMDAYMNLATLKRRAETAALRFLLRSNQGLSAAAQPPLPPKDEDRRRVHIASKTALDEQGGVDISSDVSPKKDHKQSVDDASKASAAYSLLSIGSCGRQELGIGEAREELGSLRSSSGGFVGNIESDEESDVIFLKRCQDMGGSTSNQTSSELFQRVAPEGSSSAAKQEWPSSQRNCHSLKKTRSEEDSSSATQTNASNALLLPTAATRLVRSSTSDLHSLVFHTGLHPVGTPSKSDPFEKIVVKKRDHQDSDRMFALDAKRKASSESLVVPSKTQKLSENSVATKAPKESADDDNSKSILLQKRRRLKLLRHAIRCSRSGRPCNRRSCPQVRMLCEHIRMCRDSSCSTPHCQSSREILRHFRHCQDDPKRGMNCEICGPLVKKIKVTTTDDEEDRSPSFEAKDYSASLNANFAKTKSGTFLALGSVPPACLW